MKFGNGSFVHRRRGVTVLAPLLAASIVAALMVGVVGSASRTGAATTSTTGLPPGFVQTTLAGGLQNPIAIAFAPNGDIWIGEKVGKIVIYHNGAVEPNPVLSISVDSTSELGLEGLAFDPNFSTNGFFYVSYVTAGGFSRVSRFTDQNGIANTSSEKILIQGTLQQTNFGPGEDLKIGPDGKLWWSVGDDEPAYSNAHTLGNIYGKIIRINLDGTIPSDNPFTNIPGAVPSIYAWGLRNPFRFTFLPNGKLMTEDTGSSYWEEMDTIQKGGNYGWNFYEGNCYSCGYINPVYAYGHVPADGAESAIAAYSGSTFPKQYDNVVFFGDYNRQDIEAVTFDPTYQTETSDNVFDTNAGTIADLQEGPDGNLYFVSVFNGTFSKISTTGAINPTASASATPNAGMAPLSVQFSSAGTSDPFGKPLTYSWNFGDGSPTSTSANPVHSYSSNGTYTATLTASNGSLSGTTTTKVVVGRPPPVATITTPTVGTPYQGGETVNFAGKGTDAVDGQLPNSDLTWQVDFYNNGVAEPFYNQEVPHPFYGPTSGISTGSFQIPNDISQTPGSFYRITLTAVDSAGIPTKTTVDIHPQLTTWTANANVPGAAFVVDGTWQTGTYTAQDVTGVQHVLTGVPVQTVGGVRYRFVGWSDGSGLSSTFTSQTTNVTRTAIYDPVQSSLPAGWTSTDVGNPLTAGSTDYSPSTSSFYLDGGGADLFGTSDQSHYTYQTLNGDGTIVARVRYQTESDAWTKAGLMIKQAPTVDRRVWRHWSLRTSSPMRGASSPISTE